MYDASSDALLSTKVGEIEVQIRFVKQSHLKIIICFDLHADANIIPQGRKVSTLWSVYSVLKAYFMATCNTNLDEFQRSNKTGTNRPNRFNRTNRHG